MNTKTPAQQNALVASAARKSVRAAEAILFWMGEGEDADEMIAIVRGARSYWDADTYIREKLCDILDRI